MKFIKSGNFTGAVVGGSAGAKAGFVAATIICPPFAGVCGVGTILCGLVVGGMGAGGAIGENLGEEVGEVVYEMALPL